MPPKTGGKGGPQAQRVHSLDGGNRRSVIAEIAAPGPSLNRKQIGWQNQPIEFLDRTPHFGGS
jgi:hypothetical protein